MNPSSMECILDRYMTVNQALEQIIETSNLRPDVAEVRESQRERERERERERKKERERWMDGWMDG